MEYHEKTDSRSCSLSIKWKHIWLNVPFCFKKSERIFPDFVEIGSAPQKRPPGVVHRGSEVSVRHGGIGKARRELQLA